MVKARTWLALGLMSLGTIAAVVGCGSDETTGGGGGLITAGAGGTAGTGGTGAVGRGGSTASGGSSGTGTIAAGNLGATCTSDLDCGSLTCLLPTGTELGSGGPGLGMCTQTCKSDLDCDAAEPGAGCIPVSSTVAYCFEACTVGNPTTASAKCQGRADFLCTDLSTAMDGSETFCVPLCQSDDECGTGAYCSPKSGLCQKTKPTGDPLGTACDPNATDDTCAGFCLQTSADGAKPVTGACTQVCSGATECNFNGSKAGGFCARVPGDGGFLDIGLCEPSCNCDSDCKFPGDVCQAWTANANASLVKDLGTDGFCFPNATGSTELTCGEGGAGGMGNMPGEGESGAGGAAGAH